MKIMKKNLKKPIVINIKNHFNILKKIFKNYSENLGKPFRFLKK